MKNTQISSRLVHHGSSSSTVSIANHQGKSMTKKLRIVGCLLLVPLFTALTAFGQTDTATIVGTVLDQSGAVLPNAEVTITNIGTNLKMTIKSDNSGNFVATPLKIGNYSIAVKA